MKRTILIAVLLLMVCRASAADLTGMKTVDWLSLSPDQRALYVSGVWEGFMYEGPMQKVTYFGACIQKRDLTWARLSADMLTNASEGVSPGNWPPPYLHDLLFWQLTKICGFPPSADH
jgi:hypothetical protein